MAYTKLFQELITSSIWCLEDSVRVAWITMLASADRNGEVMGAVPGMARMANIEREEFDKALGVFLSPDPDSRNPTDEGRRIEVIDGGWRIINYEHFRRKASAIDKREKDAARQKAKYDRDNRNSQNLTHTSQPPHNHLTPKSDIAEAEAEAEADKKLKEKKVPKKKFVAPTGEEAKVYANEIKLSLDECQGWFDHFSANGWKTGAGTGKPVKDWKATMRTWKRNGEKYAQNSYGNGTQAHPNSTQARPKAEGGVWQWKEQIKLLEAKIKTIKNRAEGVGMQDYERQEVKGYRAKIKALESKIGGAE